MNTNKIVRDSLIFGFALFAVFFGAGNLIFPPSIGLASGSDWLPALAGFILTGIVLPILGVVAVLNSKGKFEELTRPISPWFYKVFNLVVMIGIAMLVTVPRTAATTHEMGVHTLFPNVPSFVTMIVFFGLNFYFASDRSNLIDKVGQVLTPALFAILLFIVIKGTFDPLGAPVNTEIQNPFGHSFFSAYQTGDVFTGLLCASVFIGSIAAKGYAEPSKMKQVVMNGTIVAGLGLLIIYGGLLYIGATGSGLFPNEMESAQLVTGLVYKLLGDYGTIALAIAVSLACLTTSIGITASIADFLSGLTKQKVSYRNWVIVVCTTGVLMGLMGVEKIIDYSVPLFMGIYPVSIVIVLLGVFRRYIPNAGAYKGSVLATFIISLCETLESIGIQTGFLNDFISILPFSANGFAWLIPAVLGFVAGSLIHGKQAQEISSSRMAGEKHSS
ncbi:branched-chain amino acid transport system II carrier protein [Peribacillus frigoritolerans]|uniref:Branched-chain amino acid transport system carrier protein n=2 Tax=Peribacillus frigoritolerans TaxID=450367 RepID=A0AAJ1QR63_9BACI|nr:branched-chain amino acid transport system II carrier protein [Peribacillus frigoritolerans]MDM5285953.1 branched-chain amino acid transport system II carrier protein [Peribacillus frigoritolerans]